MNITSHSTLLRTFVHWLPMAIIITLLSGLCYGTIRQNIRQSADDPQIEMAEDTATALTTGISPQSIIPAGKIDIAESLALYIIIYNESGYPLIASGELDNQIPVIPSGVLKYASLHGQDRLTWQPKPGVRSAIVVIPFKGNPSGFVLAGRSLREIEKREDHIFNMVFWTWLVTNLSTLGFVIVFRQQEV